MSLLKYQTLPFLVGNRFNREFDAFLPDRFYGNTVSTSTPAVNIVEDKESFRIEVAAPGMKKEDFKINLNNNHLTISAQQPENKVNENGEKYARREFSYRSFQRTFTLPQSVEGEKVEATYTDGILHVALPKREEAKVKPAREIAIA